MSVLLFKQVHWSGLSSSHKLVDRMEEPLMTDEMARSSSSAATKLIFKVPWLIVCPNSTGSLAQSQTKVYIATRAGFPAASNS